MPELEKIGKVLDSKIKALTESGKKKIVDNTASVPSALDQLKLEQNELFTELGKTVYENRKAEEHTEYERIFTEIQNKQQLIEAETNKQQVKCCAKCGFPVTEGAIFCLKCGEKVSDSQEGITEQCPRCGSYLKANAKFCVKCGEKLQ